MDHDKHRQSEVKDSQVDKSRVPTRGATPPEDPEDYSDPICVCEPEPYWQEIAERMEREAHSPK